MARIEHIHLDAIGGIAGDMFAAAMADAFPECVPGLLAELNKLEGRVGFAAHHDGVLRGLRFVIGDDGKTPPHDHSDSAHDHLHVPYRDIRARLEAAGLDAAVLRHALALFDLLARAEADVHGVAADEVEFHEVGAWDSIADFIAAAYFIATLAPSHWSISALPLGGGRVKTAHGVLPVPTPATVLLMKGLEVFDDGVAGERVTPTGAAIARYLTGSGGAQRRGGQVIVATGNGFGTRKLPGMPNVLRCLAYAASPSMPAPLDEEIAVLQFEIDDQTAEDLAVALERVRQAPGVLDVTQAPVYAKKGRLATQVQVLARTEAADAVANLCLSQTTTLGVRISRVWRRTAMRAQVQTQVPEPVRVKVAERPTGELTAKAEMEDLARIPGDRAQREEARRRAESEALAAAKPYDDRKPD